MIHSQPGPVLRCSKPTYVSDEIMSQVKYRKPTKKYPYTKIITQLTNYTIVFIARRGLLSVIIYQVSVQLFNFIEIYY